MIGVAGWDYKKAIKIASDRTMNVEGVFGYSENRGATEPAMKEILKDMYKVN